MGLYEDIVAGKEKLSLVGLGYVGMPIAVAFARKVPVIGYDLNEEKIRLYQSGVDPTREVGDDVIRETKVEGRRRSYLLTDAGRERLGSCARQNSTSLRSRPR